MLPCVDQATKSMLVAPEPYEVRIILNFGHNLSRGRSDNTLENTIAQTGDHHLNLVEGFEGP
jgi:hypothetical protein